MGHKHYLFSKAAFALLSAKLSGCNDVLKAIGHGHEGVSGRHVTTQKDVATLLRHLRDRASGDWYGASGLMPSAPDALRSGRVDGKPLLELYGRYRTWADGRVKRLAKDPAEKNLNEKTIQRAFVHLLTKTANWSADLPSQLSGPFGVTDLQGYASLFSHLIWGCDIRSAMQLPGSERYLLEFDKADGNAAETEDEGERSPSEEPSSGPEMSRDRRLLWALAVAGVVLLVLYGVSAWWRGSDPGGQEQHDNSISGNGHTLMQNGSGKQYNIGTVNIGPSASGPRPMKLPGKSEDAKVGAVSPHIPSHLPEKMESIAQDRRVDGPLVATGGEIEISGTVLDGNSMAAVSGARMKLTTGASVTSDEDGGFRFSVPARYAGSSQRILIQKDGYPSSNQEITIGKDADYQLLITAN